MTKKTVSCVIPTYNRCPRIDDIKYNPPWWASFSLSKQENVGEIIFVDDGSEDYTEQVIEKIRKKLPVDVVYLKNEKNIGLPASRNMGVKSSKYDKIWFMDDDCVIVSDDVIPKVEYAFELLKSKGVDVGSMSLPVSGNSLESEIISGAEIGKVGRETGIMYACNSKFPEEYLENLKANYLDFDKGILNPLKVEFSHAVFLCDKSAFNDVGGFSGLSWRNFHTEESQFLINLNKKGHETFYLPSLDKDFRVFHCRYGDPSFKRIPYNFSVDGISFNQILKESAVKRENTGCRISTEEYLHSHILSEMVLTFSFYDKGIGIKNLKSKFKNISEGKFFPEIKKNIEIFQDAIREGIGLLEKDNLIDNKTKRYLLSEYS